MALSQLLQPAQQTKAPFSFHCRICYERLNLTDRPPVVLPCGHTYICQQCSERLTRCMECRKRITPLAPPPPPVAQQAQQPSAALNIDASRQYPHGHIVRKSYRQRQQEGRQNYYLQKEQQRMARARQEQEFPVPTTVDELHTVLKKTADPPPKHELPKNVVLMSLMEAAQEKLPVEKKWKNFSASDAKEEEEDDGYESGDDDDMVISGLRAVSSSYGTYVVKAKEGLWVYDMKPGSLSNAIPMSRSGSHSSRNSATGSNSGYVSIQSLLPPGGGGSSSSVVADPPGKSPSGKSPQGKSPPGQMLLPKHPNHPHQIVPQQLQLKLLQHQQKENEEPVPTNATNSPSNARETTSSPTPLSTPTLVRKSPPSPEHIRMQKTIQEQMQSMESRVSKLREINRQSSTTSTITTAALTAAASSSTLSTPASSMIGSRGLSSSATNMNMGLSSSERGSSSTRQQRRRGSSGSGRSNSAARSRSRTKSPSSTHHHHHLTQMMDPAVNTSFMSISSIASTNVASNVQQQQQPLPAVQPPKPIEKLIHGQTVQIVHFDRTDCIAQLARGGGYIRVDDNDDLVKVGEPTDEACKIEGIILSVAEERRQHKKQINALHKLEKRLHTNLRSFFVREAEELEEKRQQAKLELEKKQQQQASSLLNTSIDSNASGRTASSIAEELLAESSEDELEQKYPGNLTPPSTPPPGLLEMSPSGMSSGPDTPASPPRGGGGKRGGTRSSTSRSSGGSCGVGRQLRYELTEEQGTTPTGGGGSSSGRSGISAPTNTPVANKKKRDKPKGSGGIGVDDDDDGVGEEKKTDCNSESSSPVDATAWHDNDLFTQGCDLFFCATMPLCIGHNTASATDLSSITAGIPYTSSVLGGQPPTTTSASSSSPHHHHHHRRKGSGGGDGMMGSPYRNSTSGGRYQYNNRGSNNRREPDYVLTSSPGIPRDESYDGGSNIDGGGSHISAGSGGYVDFATGMSGHAGISRNHKRRGAAPRKQVRMMSQHDGIAHIRRPKNTGGASVISMGGCSKASVVTL